VLGEQDGLQVKIRFYIDPETGMHHIHRKMKTNKFPPGWDDASVRRVLDHYEAQTEEEAVAEDEAAYEDTSQTFMGIPNALVPKVRELIAKQTR